MRVSSSGCSGITLVGSVNVWCGIGGGFGIVRRNAVSGVILISLLLLSSNIVLGCVTMRSLVRSRVVIFLIGVVVVLCGCSPSAVVGDASFDSEISLCTNSSTW